jgi:hypothetical protein
MIGNNKGFFSFCLLFIFLNAGFAKNIAAGFVSKSDKVEVTHHNSVSKYDLTATSLDDSEDNVFDQLKKDSSPDDSEFIFITNFSSKAIINFQEQHQFAEIGMCSEMYSDSLYDLYCNWKFHLA